MNKEYLELTRLIERLHRRFLDVLRSELNRLGIKDINGVQARIRRLEEHNAAALAEHDLSGKDIEAGCEVLRRLERTWTDCIHYGGS